MYERGRRNTTVKFSLRADGAARDVCVTGTFSAWKPLPMRKQKDGLFTRTVPGMNGTFEYKFVVDGSWITDPDHSHWVVSPVGTLNSLGVPPSALVAAGVAR